MEETANENFQDEADKEIKVHKSEERELRMTVNRTTLPQFVNLFPIFFVFVLLAWTYASYILWSFQLLHTNLYPTISCLVIYHFFLVMMITSYVKCIITDPGTVPSVYLEKFSHIVRENQKDSLQFDADMCRKCGAKKPERSHHCSTCKKCILKMDHHCPWINNCVGFRNHKYFMLFLTYTVLLSITIVSSFARWIKENLLKSTISFIEIQIFSSFIISFIFGLVLSIFTLSHYRYIFRNVTTLEHMEKRRLWKRRRKQLIAIKDARSLSQSELNELRGKFSSPYDVGTRKNFEQVFGTNPLLWFIPVNRTTLDGIVWPSVSDSVVSEEAKGLLETQV